nr:organomercurial transporter MerC [Sulfuricystis multivorans]
MLRWINRIGDKAGSLGALVSAMGCAMCFPAIASLGAALGLGFLGQWEELFIGTLLPASAVLLLVVHALGWFAHRQWQRSLLGMLGPVLLLLALYLWFDAKLIYVSLALMVAVSLWDLFSPASRRCDDRCTLPAKEIGS